jgi:monoamine oxidase
MRYQVAIVGGGLAGLIVARELEALSIDYVLLEARDRLGGRILSVDPSNATPLDGLDLGPSWFWQHGQPIMDTLLDQIGLSSFPQHGEGDIVFQRMSRERPQRAAGRYQTHGTMRITGGTAALVNALGSLIPISRIKLDCQVVNAHKSPCGVELACRTTADIGEMIAAEHVVFAVPPRLLQSTVIFVPSVEPGDEEKWRNTPTWMAPHAKFVAVYDAPFWRADGLSGTAQSMVGPLAEIHDATTAGGQAALFGFVGVPAIQRQHMGHKTLIAAAVEQLELLFGPKAGSPTATLLKDWAADPLTATGDDLLSGGHPSPGSGDWVSGEWRDRMVLAGSETSPTEPGYLAGAISAGKIAATEIARRLGRSTETARASTAGSR